MNQQTDDKTPSTPAEVTEETHLLAEVRTRLIENPEGPGASEQELVRELISLRGELNDAKVFLRDGGLSWSSGARTRTETDLDAWLGKRSQAGKLAPRGFPKSNRFTG